jgi:hypothetical protein
VIENRECFFFFTISINLERGGCRFGNVGFSTGFCSAGYERIAKAGMATILLEQTQKADEADNLASARLKK